jgi:hypothetical protein
MTTPSAIQLFGQNQFGAWDSVTASTGQALVGNLNDGYRDSVWRSSGSNDSTTESLVIAFMDAAGNAVSRSFDTIILQNTNVSSVRAMVQDAQGNQTVIQSLQRRLMGQSQLPGAVTGSDAIISLGTVSCVQITLYFDATQTANQDKYIGELRLVQSVAQPSVLSAWKRKDAAKSGNARLADGHLLAWQEWQRCEGTLTLQNLGKADHDAIIAALAAYDWLTVAFCYSFDPTQIFELRVTEPPTESFDRKAQLYSLELALKER